MNALSNIEQLPILDYRCHSWPLSACEPRKCPFCGLVDSALFLRPDKLPVAQCCNCRCFYITIRVPDEALLQFYEQYWGVSCPRNLTDEMAIYLLRSAAKRFLRDRCLNKLATVAGGFKEKYILDVGCGFGEKASIMKSLGAKVLGIDISPEAASFCNDKLGIQTLCLSIEDMPSGDNLFDIITMFEFIEHPLNPLEVLQAAINILKSGGLLVIATPNGTAGEKWWNNRMTDWIGFRVDLEHFHYLHVDTIDYLCRTLNCRQVHLDQFGYRALDDVLQPQQHTKQSKLSHHVRKNLKKIPGIRQAVHAFHEYRANLHGTIQPEAGDYHLFSILQKK